MLPLVIMELSATKVQPIIAKPVIIKPYSIIIEFKEFKGSDYNSIENNLKVKPSSSFIKGSLVIKE